MAETLIGVGEWKPGGWWKVLGPDGKLWCETSNQAEAIEFMRPGDVLYRHFVQKNQQWRPVGEFDQERGLIKK